MPGGGTLIGAGIGTGLPGVGTGIGGFIGNLLEGLIGGKPDYNQTEAWQRNIHRTIVEPTCREYFYPECETWLREGWANMGSKAAYTSYLQNLRTGLVTGQPIFTKTSLWAPGVKNFIPQINKAFAAAGVPEISNGDKGAQVPGGFGLGSLITGSMGTTTYIFIGLIAVVLFFVFKKG